MQGGFSTVHRVEHPQIPVSQIQHGLPRKLPFAVRRIVAKRPDQDGGRCWKVWRRSSHPEGPLLKHIGDELRQCRRPNPKRPIIGEIFRQQDLARKMGNYLMKPGMWHDTSSEGYPGREHGIFFGHFHNNTNGLVALLDLALIDKNEWLKQVVREGYDHARRTGVIRLGWLPAWSTPTRYNRPQWLLQVTEPCALGDLIVLAVRLTDAGLGDYWDDVDHIIRNQLVAQQFTSLQLMRECIGGGSKHDAMLARFLGGFGSSGTTYKQASGQWLLLREWRQWLVLCLAWNYPLRRGRCHSKSVSESGLSLAGRRQLSALRRQSRAP
jgi:hypothetical protein